MPQNNDITTRFKVDISDLKRGITEANNNIKNANAQFKAATSGMDMWTKSAEGIRAKLDQLRSVLTQQTAKLSSYEDQLTKVEDAERENGRRADELRTQLQRLADSGVSRTSEEYKRYEKALTDVEKEQLANQRTADSLRTTILNQQGAVSGIERDIRRWTSSLEDIESEQRQAESATGKLTKEISDQQKELDKLKRKYQDVVLEQGDSSDAAQDLAEEIEELSRELRTNQQRLESAERAADEYDQSLDDVEDSSNDARDATSKLNDGFTVMKGALANLIADGIRKAADAIKDFAVDMLDVAAEVKAANSQFTQTFGELEDQANEVIDGIAAKTGILATRLQSTGAGIYAFARSSGATTSEAMELMQESLEATADSAAYYDRSLEESAETLQSFLKGNFANDAALGVSATEFTRNAKATELFGEKYNDLTEIQKQQTLLKMVTDSQKLSGAMGQAAREADGWENVQGNLNETWKQFKAQVGTPFLEALIPIIQDVTKSFTEWKDSVNWIEFSNTVKDSIKKIIDVFKWFIDNRKTFTTVIEAMIAAFAVAKIGKFVTGILGMVKAFQAARIATEAATVAQARNNAVALANPYVLLAAAIAAVVVGLAAWVKKANELPKYLKEEIEQAKKEKDAVIETKKAYDDLIETQKERVSQGMSEMSYISSLKEELGGLVDANGKVKEGYEGRADFILNQLNSALGTEITMTDGVISKYDELNQTIDALIEKKKAEIILSSQEEAYTEAINNRITATQKLNEIDAQRTEIQREVSANDAEIAQLQQDLANATTYTESLAINEQIRQIQRKNQAHKDSLTELDTAYSTQEQLVGEYAYNIGQYETNMALAHEGRYDEMSTVNWDFVKDYQDAEDAQKKMLQDQLTASRTWLDELIRMRRSGNETITDEMIEAAEKEIEQNEKNLKAYTSTTKTGLDETTSEWKTALADQLGEVTNKNVEFKNAGDGQVQAFIDGVAVGQPQAETQMQSLASSVIQQITDKKADAETAGNMLLLGLNSGLSNSATRSNIKVTGAGIITDTISSMNSAGEINSPSRATQRTGEYLLDGLYNGVKNQSRQSSIFSAAWNFGKGLLKKLQDSFEERSPSKATNEMGVNLLKGLSNGIISQEKSVAKQIVKTGANTLKAFEKANDKNNYSKLGESLSKSFASGINKNVKTSITSVTGLVTNTVKALSKQNSKSTSDYKKAGKAVTTAYSEAIKAGAQKAITATDNMLTSIADKFQTQYNTIDEKRQSLKDLLSDNGALYTEDDAGKLTLKSFKDSAAVLTKYGNNLEKLKKKLPKGLMNEILGMDVESGSKYTNALLNLSSKELKAYNASYKKNENAAKSISEKYYAGEISAIEKSFSTAVKDKLDTLETTLNTVGKNAMAGLVSGMKSQKSSLKDAAKTMATTITDTLKKQLKIKSPSKVMESLAKFIPEGLSVGIDDNIGSVIDSVRNMSKKIVNASSNLLAGAQVPMLAGATPIGGMSSGSVSNVNNFTQNIYAPKQPSRVELYRQSKNLLNWQKGGR